MPPIYGTVDALYTDSDLYQRVGPRRAYLPPEFLPYSFILAGKDGLIRTDVVHARSLREAKKTVTEYAIRILRLPARSFTATVEETDHDDVPAIPI